MINLKKKSIKKIINNQHITGSYVSSPNFEPYKNCWLRDASFIAYAMDITRNSSSSDKYFEWVNKIISRYDERIFKIIKMINRKQKLLNSEYLPSRYTLDGQEIDDQWPNFQLDGYGVWLWALCEHIKITGNNSLIKKYNASIKNVIEYLMNLWDIPCFDCWEEKEDKIHTSTLACIYGGLNSISNYIDDSRIQETFEKIKSYILKYCVKNSKLTKCANSEGVDASLLWVSVPFRVLDINDEIMKNTVKEIENKLLHGGGVHRYPDDVYYGGGEWLILSSWLGWYYTEVDKLDKAKKQLNWVEKRVSYNGDLPEQSLEHVNNPQYIEMWQNLWGDVATPSLWSHAMYLILLDRLGIVR